jgi:hypothetical protein
MSANSLSAMLKMEAMFYVSAHNFAETLAGKVAEPEGKFFVGNRN